jgi:hypothetical protein
MALMKHNRTALLILFSVVTVVSVGLLWQTNQEVAKLEEEVALRTASLHRQIALREQMNELLTLDAELLIDGDYEAVQHALAAALLNYDTALALPIQQRISYLNEIEIGQNNGNDSLDERDQLLKRQRAMLQAAQNQLDSTHAAHWQHADSLKSLIARAHEEIRKKDKALQKEQRVQVISFLGSKGATIHYLGEVVDGKANGGGVGIWSTGSLYRGDWRNNLRHGKGSFEWADGEKYSGEYVDGKREGEGTYTWPSGERYEGQWMNDRRNGEGILYDLDGNKRYDGPWKDDKPVN